MCKCKPKTATIVPTQWADRFKNWIVKGREELNVFEIILDIFAGLSTAFDEMRFCRVNPDYSSNTRNDLEFYIPQLCSYVFDESKPRELRDCLIVILMEAANASFYFSHRLYFFLHSYENDTGLSEEVRTMYVFKLEL